MIIIDAEVIRDEVRETFELHDLTPDQVQAILALPDETVEASIDAIAMDSNPLCDAINQVRSDIIDQLAVTVIDLPVNDPLPEAIADALKDRGAITAAQFVLEDPDGSLWNHYLGPLLDELATNHPENG